MSGLYLIWSNEHQAWWGSARWGYVKNFKNAGVYKREEAIAICRNAIPGTYQRLGMLPEIPVRMDDIAELMKIEQ